MSKVILKTRCGCSRMMEWDEALGPTIRVPLYNGAINVTRAALDLPTAHVGHEVREFQRHDEVYVSGDTILIYLERTP